MNQLKVLMHKEWRDQRTLTIGAFIACCAFLVIARLLSAERFDWVLRSRLVLPTCLGLFVVVLAIEVVTRDVQSGGESLLLRLPVRRGTVWLAKTLFVILSSIGFFVALAMVEIVVRVFEQRASLDLEDLGQPLAWLLIAAAAAACSATACVLRRSLPAAFIGVALVASVPLIGWALPDGRIRAWFDVGLCSWTLEVLSALVCGAFLLGSFLAYRVRRADGFGLRRASAVALGAAIVLLPAIASSARCASKACDIEPFDPAAEIVWVAPSPDGRYLALQVQQTWKPRDNWIVLSGKRTGNGVRVRSELWILDRESGALRQIDERFRGLGSADRTWDGDGRIIAVSSDGCFGDGECVWERIDPSTGVVAASHAESTPEKVERWYERSTVGADTLLRWTSKGIQLRLSDDTHTWAAPLPGVVFHVQDGFVVRHELEPERTTKLLELKTPLSAPLRASPDGRYLLVRDAVEPKVIDARDGRVVHSFGTYTALAEWSQLPGVIGIFCQGRGSWMRLAENGSLEALPTHMRWTCELDRSHLLSYDSQRIECVGVDGVRTLLYEPRP